MEKLVSRHLDLICKLFRTGNELRIVSGSFKEQVMNLGLLE